MLPQQYSHCIRQSRSSILRLYNIYAGQACGYWTGSCENNLTLNKTIETISQFILGCEETGQYCDVLNHQVLYTVTPPRAAEHWVTFHWPPPECSKTGLKGFYYTPFPKLQPCLMYYPLKLSFGQKRSFQYVQPCSLYSDKPYVFTHTYEQN